ncbi:E3 ubiquitin-protein ligase MIB2-like protein [Leptotrombidium deliense]|uniref:Alpha-latrotoxin n=1 Tax=Leptotrombidium deliense TaxID=299467 RepID=A0A443RYV3_9ACAR|nr:E3 ubiquitin-protein ligase MIB2-like protein [Leptotrombidium deliense]
MDFSLIYFSSNGELESVRKLITDGADLNVKDCDGNTAVHKAAEGNHVEVLNLLLEAGADKNVVNFMGNSALHIAISNMATESVKLLLNKGIEVNRFNLEEKSELMYAMKIASNGPVGAKERFSRNVIIDLLINHENIDIRCTSVGNRIIFNGENYLFYAVRHHHSFFVKKILEKDPSLLEAKNKQGNYPIHAAVYSNNLESLMIILEMNKEMLNVRGVFKYTPLLYAVEWQFFDIIAYLVQQKADANLPDNGGRTPLHQTIIQYSKCCKNKCNAKCTPQDYSAASYTIFENNLVGLKTKCFSLAIAIYLIENTKANIYVCNNEGKTPLDLLGSEKDISSLLTTKYINTRK